MARNVELKAQVPVEQFAALRARALEIAGAAPQELSQTDTFFCLSRGRLKLRELGTGPAELIFYERPDEPGPKTSSYVRSPTDSPCSLRQALAGALGIRGVVRKRRLVWLVQQTRIHLDEVEGLGPFVELEVVLQEGQSEADGLELARRWMDRLGISASWLVSEAYIDLLEQ